MFIEKRSFIKKCLTPVSSKIYKLRNIGGGYAILQYCSYLPITSLKFPSISPPPPIPIYIFLYKI